MAAFTGGAERGGITVEVRDLKCVGLPDCSEDNRRKVESIVGKSLVLGTSGVGDFEYNGTYGCFWMHNAPLSDDDLDYVIVGQRAPVPDNSTSDAFQSFFGGHGYSCSPQGPEVTCTKTLSETEASVERWVNGTNFALLLRIHSSADPLALALRVLNEVSV